MKSVNPHRPRVFGDPLHPDLHEYAREHYGSIYEYMATCDFIALEHLREHHLLKKKREDGKCEFKFIQDKQRGIVKTVFEGRIE